MYDLNYLHPFFIKKSEARPLNPFWFGFILYSLGYVLSLTNHVDPVICQFFQVIGLFIFILSALPLFYLRLENKYLKIIFTLYCSWLFIVVLRGFALNYNSVKETLLDGSFGIFVYLAPLILLFPKKIFFYRKAFDVIVVLCLLYVALSVVFINDLLDPDFQNANSRNIVEFFTKNLSLPAGFLLLTYAYHSKRRMYLVVFITILTLFFVIVRARRALILITLSPALIAYIIYIVNHKKKFLIISFTLFIACLITLYGLIIFNESKIFNSVKERGLEDTRTGVEIAFYKDMNTTDWIIGKGMNGVYYCPGIDSDNSKYRSMIETNYLQIILKGGIISLGLLLLIIVPACIKGIFYSKNMLSKAAGIWILLWIFCLYPANVDTFTMNYLLVWMCVGICYTKKIRNMPDDFIKQYFKSPSKNFLKTN